jgi:hypothetical protein
LKCSLFSFRIQNYVVLEIKSFIMSRLLAFCIYFFWFFSADAQFNDTLFLKSDQMKIVTVRQHDEKFLTYDCMGRGGKLVEKRVRLAKLKAFVIYDESGVLVRDSRHPKRKEQ